VLRDDAGTARKVSVDNNAWDPGQPVARENKRPCISLFARHARVNKDVLELASASPASRAHRQARTAKAQLHVGACLEVGGVLIRAAQAPRDLEARALSVSTLGSSRRRASIRKRCSRRAASAGICSIESTS